MTPFNRQQVLDAAVAYEQWAQAEAEKILDNLRWKMVRANKNLKQAAMSDNFRHNNLLTFNRFQKRVTENANTVLKGIQSWPHESP
jgi:hypothetical protein